MLLDQLQPGRAEGEEVNLLPPPELNVSLWRSLLTNLRDRFLPVRQPPLKLSSRPVDVGMLVGDMLDVPWYRTILSSIGDIISPRILPPLHLESQPVDVELISDLPAWWQSLLRNLADALAPERQSALRLTSLPVNPEMASNVLMAPRWSALIDTPEVSLPDPWSTSLDRPVPVAVPMRTILVQLPPLDAPVDDDFERQLLLQMLRSVKRSVRRSHIREIIWLSVAVAEVTLLIVLRLTQH
jgi:hypothetical protein